MAKNKSRVYVPKTFESDPQFLIGRNYDTSANIYMSMMLSPAWLDLSKAQQILYLYCKAQYYGKNKKEQKELMTAEELLSKKEVDTSKRFFMNREMWLNFYKIYPDNGQFYKDIKVLCDFGFIKTIERNQNTKKRNIYEFTDQWRFYKKE